MPGPKFEESLYPFLTLIKGKDMTSKDVKNALVKHFHLSKEDCALETKSGTNTQVNDRINWTRQYLRRAQFVDLPQKGNYHISARGKEFLSTHTTLTKKDLMEYPEFSNYTTGTSVASQTPNAESPAEPQERTPTEQLELTRYMIEFNVDVSNNKVYEVKRIDSDYFEE